MWCALFSRHARSCSDSRWDLSVAVWPIDCVVDVVQVCKSNSFEQLQSVVKEVTSMGYSASQIIAQVPSVRICFPR
jgi:hypothetical protein